MLGEMLGERLALGDCEGLIDGDRLGLRDGLILADGDCDGEIEGEKLALGD